MEKISLVLLPGVFDVAIWIKSGTTVRELLTTAAQMDVTLYNGQSMDHVLDDPDYATLLDQDVFTSGLLECHVLKLFSCPQSLLVIVTFAGQAHYFSMPLTATVRDAKQRVMGLLRSRLVEHPRLELQITGTRERPDGAVLLLTLTQCPHRNISFDLVRRPAFRIGELIPASINETIFRKHLQRSRFQAGIDKRLWRLVSINWPHVVIALRVEGKDDVREQCVRFRLDTYPAATPTIELWDQEHQRVIPCWEWPAWFTEFVTGAYPHLVVLDPLPYSTEVLDLSLSIAHLRKQNDGKFWNPAADITQCLAPLINHFLNRDLLLRKDSDARQPRIRSLVPYEQSARTRKAVSGSHQSVRAGQTR
jgi:hypothetical protein